MLHFFDLFQTGQLFVPSLLAHSSCLIGKEEEEVLVWLKLKGGKFCFRVALCLILGKGWGGR